MKAIVTGHSRGLGAALAEALVARGIPVLGLARRPHPDLGARYPGLLAEIGIDLADSAVLAHWLAGGALGGFLAGCGGALLINNAGTVAPVGLAGTLAPEAIADAVALNVAAPLMLTDALLAATPAAAWRRILHVSSGAARSAYAGWSVYCATKAALDHHARAIAAEGQPDVAIASVAPGVVDTDMQAAIRATPPARFPSHDRFVALHVQGGLSRPADVARQLVDYLLGDGFGRSPTADLRDL